MNWLVWQNVFDSTHVPFPALSRPILLLLYLDFCLMVFTSQPQVQEDAGPRCVLALRSDTALDQNESFYLNTDSHTRLIGSCPATLPWSWKWWLGKKTELYWEPYSVTNSALGSASAEVFAVVLRAIKLKSSSSLFFFFIEARDIVIITEMHAR